MNKLEQAARQALEAFETLNGDERYKTYSAAAALREALAEQAAQEPVAIDWEPLQNFWRNNISIDWGELESAVKCAVAAPVRTKDLTDDEIWEIWFKDITLDWDERCRAVIAADREKNK